MKIFYMPLFGLKSLKDVVSSPKDYLNIELLINYMSAEDIAKFIYFNINSNCPIDDCIKLSFPSVDINQIFENFKNTNAFKSIEGKYRNIFNIYEDYIHGKEKPFLFIDDLTLVSEVIDSEIIMFSHRNINLMAVDKNSLLKTENKKIIFYDRLINQIYLNTPAFNNKGRELLMKSPLVKEFLIQITSEIIR